MDVIDLIFENSTDTCFLFNFRSDVDIFMVDLFVDQFLLAFLWAFDMQCWWIHWWCHSRHWMLWRSGVLTLKMEFWRSVLWNYLCLLFFYCVVSSIGKIKGLGYFILFLLAPYSPWVGNMSPQTRRVAIPEIACTGKYKWVYFGTVVPGKEGILAVLYLSKGPSNKNAAEPASRWISKCQTWELFQYRIPLQNSSDAQFAHKHVRSRSPFQLPLFSDTINQGFCT